MQYPPTILQGVDSLLSTPLPNVRKKALLYEKKNIIFFSAEMPANMDIFSLKVFAS